MFPTLCLWLGSGGLKGVVGAQTEQIRNQHVKMMIYGHDLKPCQIILFNGVWNKTQTYLKYKLLGNYFGALWVHQETKIPISISTPDSYCQWEGNLTANHTSEGKSVHQESFHWRTWEVRILRKVLGSLSWEHPADLRSLHGPCWTLMWDN